MFESREEGEAFCARFDPGGATKGKSEESTESLEEGEVEGYDPDHPELEQGVERPETAKEAETSEPARSASSSGSGTESESSGALE